MNTNELLEKIDLAIGANGGTEVNLDWCECDASVGHFPCRYCAIRDALESARKFVEQVSSLIEANASMNQDESRLQMLAFRQLPIRR